MESIKWSICRLQTADGHVFKHTGYYNLSSVRRVEQNAYTSADQTFVGPRYQPKDFKLICGNYLSKDMSGLMVCGINNGTSWAHKLKDSKSPTSYRVKGLLGQATDTYFITGKIIEKSTYKYIKRNTIDKICASMQAAH